MIKKIKYILFLFPLLIISISRVNAVNVTPTQNRLLSALMYATEGDEIGYLKTAVYWKNQTNSTNLILNYGNKTIKPITLYYTAVMDIAPNRTYNASFTLSINYDYDPENGILWSLQKNLNSYKFGVFEDYGAIANYSCSYSNIRTTKVTSSSYVTDIPITCNFVVNTTKADAWITMGFGSIGAIASQKWESYNGYISGDFYHPFYNVSNISISYMTDNSSIIVDQNNTIISQNTQIYQEINETNKNLDELNKNITDDDINGANGKGSEFFNNFSNNDHGLTSIITIPLDLIKSISSSTCQELTLTIPFVNKTFNLPCMTAIYQEHFPTFLSIYQTITFGIVSYWIAIQIYALVKGFKDPDNDKIEVVDL